MRDGWETVRVSDVATVVGGGTPKSGVETYWGGDVPWLTPKDLSQKPARYTSSGERSITEEGLKASGARLLPPGSVLLTSRAPVGYVTVASAPIATNQGFKSLVLKEGQVPEFWYYLLGHSTEFLRAHSGGSTFAELSGSALTTLEFTIPPVLQQWRIVDLIGAVDDAIADASIAVESLVATAVATIYRTWGDETPQVPLRSVFSHVIGGAWGSPPGQEDADVLALGPRSYAGRTEVAPETASPRSLSFKRAADRILKVGDVVLERSGGTPTQPVGRVIRMTSPVPNVVPSDFQRLLRPDPAKADPGFVFWHMWANYEAGHSVPFQRATTNIRNLDIPSYLAQTVMPLPDLAAQQQHGAMADSFATVAMGYRAAAGRLRTLRSNLLTALLSGEHRIPEAYDQLVGG